MSDAPQGSEAWLQARCGLATASEFAAIVAKGAEKRMRTAYLRRVVTERLTGKPSATYATGTWLKNLERGKEQEPYARMAYEAITGNLVEESEFIKHPTLMAGCSPDGLIGIDGGAEIKSVIPTVQMQTVLDGKYPPEHAPQIQGTLWLLGRTWWDFCSFSPDMPEHLRTYVFRVVRDEPYIANLAVEVKVFLAEADLLVKKLMERK